MSKNARQLPAIQLCDDATPEKGNHGRLMLVVALVPFTLRVAGTMGARNYLGRISVH